MTALFYPFRKRKKYTRDKSSFFATRFALYILAGWRYALITAYQLVRGKSILPRPEQLISFIPQPFPAEPMLRGLFLRLHGLSKADMDPDVWEEFFAGKNWDSFLPEEQIVFRNHTAYIAIY